MQRREYLTALGGVTAVGLAGCTDDLASGGDETDEPTRSGWSTFRGDAARTGARPADAGPGTPLSVEWETNRTDLIAEFGTVDPEEVQLPNAYTSWPVLNDEFVFWTIGYEWYESSGDDRGSGMWLVATDPEDGSTAWIHDVDTGGVGGTSWWAPELDGGRLYHPYLEDGGLGIEVLDPSNGDVLERFALGLPIRSEQPLVSNGTIYLRAGSNAQGTLHAFDAVEGDAVWTVESTYPNMGRPGLAASEDSLWSFDRVDGRYFVCRDVDDGAERWRTPLDLPRSHFRAAPTLLGSPTVVDGRGYAAGHLETYLQRDVGGPLVSFDSATGDERWRYTPPGVDDREFLARKFPNASPEKLESLPAFFATYGFPLALDGLVVVSGIGDPAELSGDDPSFLFGVDPGDGTLQWALDAEIALAPVAAGDTVYLATKNGVEAVSTAGERLGGVELPDARHLDSPAVGHGRLYVPTGRGLVAIG